MLFDATDTSQLVQQLEDARVHPLDVDQDELLQKLDTLLMIDKDPLVQLGATLLLQDLTNREKVLIEHIYEKVILNAHSEHSFVQAASRDLLQDMYSGNLDNQQLFVRVMVEYGIENNKPEVRQQSLNLLNQMIQESQQLEEYQDLVVATLGRLRDVSQEVVNSSLELLDSIKAILGDAEFEDQIKKLPVLSIELYRFTVAQKIKEKNVIQQKQIARKVSFSNVQDQGAQRPLSLIRPPSIKEDVVSIVSVKAEQSQTESKVKSTPESSIRPASRSRQQEPQQLSELRDSSQKSRKDSLQSMHRPSSLTLKRLNSISGTSFQTFEMYVKQLQQPTTEHNWELQVESFNQLALLVSQEQQKFKDSIKVLYGCLADKLANLRSILVKSALTLLIEMLRELKGSMITAEFDPIVNQIICKVGESSSKAAYMATSLDECLHLICTEQLQAQQTKTIQAISKQYVHKNAVIRQKVAECLLKCIENSQKIQKLEVILPAVVKLSSDPQQETRTFAKQSLKKLQEDPQFKNTLVKLNLSLK